MTLRSVAASLSLVLLSPFAIAADADSPVSASELAARINAKNNGTSYIRVRMEGGEKGVLQLQIKSRSTNAATDLVYQVLFPKERKGEAVLLHKSGSRMSGTLFTPPDRVRTLEDLSDPLFGSDLSYEDVIDDVYAWDQQAIVGTEVIDNINCQILESKPGKGAHSSYASVRSWVDPRRFVPLRIEKYGSGGKLVRRINTTRVLLDGRDSIPANLSIRGPRGSVTELDGSRIKRGVTFADAEFSPAGLKELKTPRGTAE